MRLDAVRTQATAPSLAESGNVLCSNQDGALTRCAGDLRVRRGGCGRRTRGSLTNLVL